MALSVRDKIIETMEIVEELELNDWENEFLESVLDQVNDGKEMSDDQMKIIDRLYNRACASEY